MDYNNDFERQIEDAERERRKKERKEKWAKREKSFWKAFLFTEDGKPKSGLMVYTFCLSIVFVLLYIGAFNLIINWLSPVTAEWPVFAGNLVQSLAAGVVGVLAALILHRIFSEKRLMLGTYLWLVGYILLVSVSMIFMLGDWESCDLMRSVTCERDMALRAITLCMRSSSGASTCHTSSTMASRPL